MYSTEDNAGYMRIISAHNSAVYLLAQLQTKQFCVQYILYEHRTSATNLNIHSASLTGERPRIHHYCTWMLTKDGCEGLKTQLQLTEKGGERESVFKHFFLEKYVNHVATCSFWQAHQSAFQVGSRFWLCVMRGAPIQAIKFLGVPANEIVPPGAQRPPIAV